MYLARRLLSDSWAARQHIGSHLSGRNRLLESRCRPLESGSKRGSWDCPIHVGGGTRVKIAEAFSRKCPVVATSLGAFGYKVNDQEELLLADSPETFANACTTLLSNRELGKLLAERAWERFCREWSWNAIGPKVAAAVKACLHYSHATASMMRGNSNPRGRKH
jgi:glycosyltransferase involved in cell wall biosynthesis